MSILSICATTRMMGCLAPLFDACRGRGGMALHTLYPPRGLHTPAARQALLLAAAPAVIVNFNRAWYCCCLGFCKSNTTHVPFHCVCTVYNMYTPNAGDGAITLRLNCACSPVAAYWAVWRITAQSFWSAQQAADDQKMTQRRQGLN